MDADTLRGAMLDCGEHGDIDCVYHFALPELLKTVQSLDFADAEEMLHTVIDGKRLRDIAELPLDLAI